MRSGDGINRSGPGKRKVAFYAEKPLAKLLGEAARQGVATVAPLERGFILTGARLAVLSERDVTGRRRAHRSGAHRTRRWGIARACRIGRFVATSWLIGEGP